MPRPKGWTDKDQRMYEHVRDGELRRGRTPRKAAEIAARTVNKHRRAEGRTGLGSEPALRDAG